MNIRKSVRTLCTTVIFPVLASTILVLYILSGLLLSRELQSYVSSLTPAHWQTCLVDSKLVDYVSKAMTPQ